jgi:acyl-CoA reductase-like NAD-dependent aldehyde dehydrogenase
MRTMSGADRGRLMHRLAEEIEAAVDELALAETRDNGKLPARDARPAPLRDAADRFVRDGQRLPNDLAQWLTELNLFATGVAELPI